MGLYQRHSIGFNINPAPPAGTQVAVNISHVPLSLMGLNIPVEISTASAFRNSPSSQQLSTIVVVAHFDTGATITSIDIDLARHLNLVSFGESPCNTAAGAQMMPNFAVDLSFPNTNLSPIANLQISSCKLAFNIANCQTNPNDQRNLGLLIGRDIMAKWNIVWNGPSSTVLISD